MTRRSVGPRPFRRQLMVTRDWTPATSAGITVSQTAHTCVVIAVTIQLNGHSRPPATPVEGDDGRGPSCSVLGLSGLQPVSLAVSLKANAHSRSRSSVTGTSGRPPGPLAVAEQPRVTQLREQLLALQGHLAIHAVTEPSRMTSNSAAASFASAMRSAVMEAGSGGIHPCRNRSTGRLSESKAFSSGLSNCTTIVGW